MIVPSELDILVYWMTERDLIRVAKEAGKPKPWTSDPLLRDYRWCNVRRMDDRVSRWLIEHWYQPDGDPLTAVTAATLARLVNWPDSLITITSGFRFHRTDLGHARERLEARAAQGMKVFTGAYIVPGVPGESKIESVCTLAAFIATHAYQIHSDSMRRTWANLVQWDGLGSFLAGQIFADLAHLKAGEHWEDTGWWAPLGPGSARGMNRLHGRPKALGMGQAVFEKELPPLIEVLQARLPALFADRRLQAMDVQNCLCEYDKYRRLTLGEGTVRARYDGAGQQQEAMF